MAKLEGQSIAASYDQLLHVDRDGGGNTTTLVNVKDGDNGTTFALQLATDHIEVNGKLNIDQDANAASLYIDSESTSEHVINIPSPLTSTGRVLLINDCDALTSGGIAYFYSNSPDNTSSRNLVYINNDNAAADKAVGLYIHQDGDDAHIEFAGAGGGGIKFAADISSSDSDTLDDYEEGTWTPEMTGHLANPAGQSGTGYYTKIGRAVSITGINFVSNVTSFNGNAIITGLPFTCASGNGYSTPCSTGETTNITFADMIAVEVQNNTTTITLREMTNGGVGSSITHADFSATSTLTFACTYYV